MPKKTPAKKLKPNQQTLSAENASLRERLDRAVTERNLLVHTLSHVSSIAAGAAPAPDPENIFQRLKQLFVQDGQSAGSVTRGAPIFDDTGLGYDRQSFADRMEGPINSEFGCNHPVFMAGQLSGSATVGDCRDKIIADHGR